MSHDHEYSVLGGYNRAKIGHTIGALAAIAAPLILGIVVSVFAALQSGGWIAKTPNWAVWITSAATVYTALYWLFARYAWKHWPLKGLLKVPNLAGDWQCKGQTINPDKTLSYEWEGKVTITQDWDKLRIRLKTHQSGSNSIAAALVHDQIDGFRLLYNYQNDPRADQPELQPHRGCAEMTFNRDLTEGEGEYFNGLGRFTFGRMTWTRID